VKKVLVFAFDRPYPPNRGGRADIWRRVLGFKALGYDVYLVAWTYGHVARDDMEAEHLAEIRKVVAGYSEFRVRGGIVDFIRRLFLLPFLPSHVSSRILERAERAILYRDVLDFGPDLVWCEGPYPAFEARKASKFFSIPYVYRSHNIEHAYMLKQSKAARTVRDKIAWKLACISLERYELSCMREAVCVFDISLDDMSWWRQFHFVSHSFWLPPLPEILLANPSIEHQAKSELDVVFLGNLTTPNNVVGVKWLVCDIWPLVEQRMSSARLVIAGSNPSPEIVELAQRSPSVKFLFNVPDAVAVYRSGAVLVNPVRTGSGIQLKAVEMLAVGRPVVSTSQGVAGMPAEVKKCFWSLMIQRGLQKAFCFRCAVD